ncbi:TonB-dependent receptor [Sunxiuqinia rutila]|uniref:TonB-dependent receptor n=1 Tax=Sunxiuqinia rutila TaxID=1397841 RepID=UPI003D3658FC
MKKNWNVLPYRQCKVMLLRMKFLFLFLFVFVIQSNASIYSQNTKLSLKIENTRIEDVFKLFEEQSDFSFIYRSDLFVNERKIDVNVTNIRIEEFLEEYIILAGYSYEVINQTVVLRERKNPEPMQSVTEETQEKKVIGKVLDETGAPLPGVTVVVMGETRGVITDVNGKFEISVLPTDKLRFSFIGMEDQTISVLDSKEINLIMHSKTDELDEVTVVAFGKQKKESVLSSISTVDVSELKVPSSNLTTAMAGKISGIISYQRSGEPGQDNAEFFVRGVTTFGYAKSPLILIDGVEMSSNDLARMQPDDIASFSIMKDATATALYGARGANGVIYVTTKEGKEGKAKVSLRFERSVSSPVQEVELADPITYMKLHNEAVRTRDPLGFLPYPEKKVNNTIAGTNPNVYPVTDWYRVLFKENTVNSRLNFNVSGGGKVARYYVAGTYAQDNGMLNVDKRNNFNSNINLQKIQLRSNININITKSTETAIRFNSSFDDYTGPIDGGSGLYNKVMRSNPVLFPAFYEPDEANSYSNHILFGNYGSGNYINPYADMVKGYKEYSRANIIAQIEVKQNLSGITEGLSARAMGNTARYSFFDVSRFYNPYYYQIRSYDKTKNKYALDPINPETGTEYLGYNEGEKNVTSVFYGEAALIYDRIFGEKHNINGLVVGTMRQSLQANAGGLQQSLPYRNMGVSGRFTYSFDRRYFGEFNFGYNGSERFSEEQRFGFFPSAGIAWIISNEPMWQDLKKVVSNLKLKGTYGLVGNDAIGDASDRFFYLSQVNMNSGGASFGERFAYSKTGVSINRYKNNDITWETARKLNIGVEIGLFEKINLLVDVFREDRSNILMDRSYIPVEMGLEAKVRANVGEAYSEGIDMSFDYQNYFNDHTWLSVRGNFVYASGKFKFYEEPDYSKTPWLSRVDQPLGQRWGYIAERLFIDDNEVANSPKQFGEYAAGDIKYKDINGDDVIDFKDQVPLGYPNVPEIIYGFGFSSGWKNLDISCFLQGSARSSFWIDPRATAPFVDVDGNGSIASNNALLSVYANNVWTEENQNPYALWPRLANHIVENNTQVSTWYMQNGSFLRLKSVEAGYSLPQKLCNKIGAEQFRLYVSGTNLYTISNFKLWDPEMGSNGLGYPIQKVFNLGLQLSF